MSSSQRKLWVALNVLPGKWGRLGELPIPLIGPPARIIDDLLVVVGGAQRVRSTLPMVWVQTLKRKGRVNPMNEPNKQLKRREFLKNATPVAALALGAPGWRRLLHGLSEAQVPGCVAFLREKLARLTSPPAGSG